MANDNIIIKDAVIINRNFEGRPDKFNPAGKRSFTIRLDEEFARILEKDGWNVKIKEPEDPDDEAVGYLAVAVTFESKFPPKIVQITKKNGDIVKTNITEATASLIDSSEITDIKLEIRPYNWEFNGRTGVKAYLKTMYFELVQDPFDMEYNQVDMFNDISSSAPDDGLPFDV